MSEIVSRNDPFFGMTSLQEAMNELFAESFVRPQRRYGSAPWMPLDVYETEEGFVARLAAPGLHAENFDITVQQNTLTVSGTVSVDQPEGAHYLLREQVYGDFSRTIQFPSPVAVDKIEASLANGILTINVPKAEQARPRRISINASAN